MNEPVLITGAGVVSSIGLNKEEVLSSLLSRKSGIGPPMYLRTKHKEFPVGEVKLTNDEMASMLNIAPDIPKTRTSLMGMLALKEALGEASLMSCDLRNVGMISGTTVGGMDKSELYYLDFLSNDTRNQFILTHDCGACTEMQADYFGDFSFVSTISTACSSSANALILGANMIRNGEMDIVVAGGSECITKFHLNGFNSLMILDTAPCRPFDATRSGLNLGEGAAYLVLESQSSAIKRQVKPIALLSGYGNACDAFHQTASSPNGEGAFRAMAQALDNAGIEKGKVDYINAHGTGTPNNDLSESIAIKRLFGDKIPPVSSTKSFTGHTTSASGAIEAVICILAMRNQFLPENLNWKDKMEDGIIPVNNSKLAAPISHVLCNSFGFGGNDSSLLLTHPLVS
ncbi:MAG: beta-ketoacyl-[acyl-carrier-protein] synthase family protein [Mediterranea sp.]|jgi:3-oxoacyl-[acyl-carrier-protein] synthase-1|nr:beta-ketoacyl-[acyl-carrier-protein] synthase family protein [Mediterranea sp.]